MSCPCYVSNGYSCAGCANFVKSTAIAVSGTTLQITIPTTTLRNHQKLCVALCQSIPTVTENTTVAIVDGTTNLNVVTCKGNYVYADQLRSRKVLKLCIATDVPLAIALPASNLCCTDHSFPPITGATASTASATYATAKG